MVVDTQTVQFASVPLDGGATLAPVEVSFETYGSLNRNKSNAILILHAFSGDAHAAGTDQDGKPGWWDNMIGPGKGFDTDKYYVICSNVMGGCRGNYWACLNQPSDRLSVRDDVSRRSPFRTWCGLQKMLVEHSGISRLLAVSGGSMGAMQALRMGGGVSGFGGCRHPDCRHRAAQRAADRLQ